MILRKKADKEFYEWLKKDICYSIDKLIIRNNQTKDFCAEKQNRRVMSNLKNG